MAITVTSEVKCNELTEVTTPDSSHGLVLFNDSSNAGAKINYQVLADAILNKIVEKEYHVNDTNQTLINAIEALQENIITEKQSVEDKLSPTGIGVYGSVWDNSISLLDISDSRNNSVHLVYAANSSALSDKPSAFENYSGTIIMYRREQSIIRTGEEATESIVTLTEVLPISGRMWIATYRNETWSEWASSNGKFIQSGEIGSISVTKATYVEQQIAFPIAFSSPPTVVVGIKTGSTAPGMGNVEVAVAYGTVTTTGFSVRVYNNDTANRAPGITWIAVG